MTLLRKLALTISSAVVYYAPPSSKEWALWLLSLDTPAKIQQRLDRLEERIAQGAEGEDHEPVAPAHPTASAL